MPSTTTLGRLAAVAALAAAIPGCSNDAAEASRPDAARPPVDGPADDGRARPDAFDDRTDGGSRADAGSGECGSAGLEPGDHVRTIRWDGLDRTFYVHVPTGLPADVPVPVVFGFHGFTSSALRFEEDTSFTELADAHGFVSILTDGAGSQLGWNAGLCCGDAAENELDDVGLVRAILDQVASEVCVDRRRVHAFGFSNGGMLVHRLACEIPNVIASAASYAGVLVIDPEACTPSRPIPLMQVHGTWDVVVPYLGRLNAGFPAVRQMMEGWARRLGCEPVPEVMLEDGPTTCESFPGCDDEAELVLCTIERLGHSWPNDEGARAAMLTGIWEFLERHPL